MGFFFWLVFSVFSVFIASSSRLTVPVNGSRAAKFHQRLCRAPAIVAGFLRLAQLRPATVHHVILRGAGRCFVGRKKDRESRDLVVESARDAFFAHSQRCDQSVM